MGSVVVVGGTAGLGKQIARHYAEQGRDVILTGRDADRCGKAVQEVGGSTRSFAFDLARPHEIRTTLADVGEVDHLVLAAIERDSNTASEYSVERAIYLVTLKLVGYTAVVHALRDKLTGTASILLFGGQAKERPYPGSTTVSTVNGGVVGMVNTLALELAPVRVNAIHPGIVGDSPYWSGKADYLEGVRKRTPTGRLVTMQDIVGATVFLLENPAVNGVNLAVDGGWLLM
ncbi:MAG: SDR family oxidoreductase [Micromonosporaceae bacterium]|nr:SDR family oxidoreductase [Micromonosporaceae bacterium]